MKRYLFILLCTILVLNCKNDKSTPESQANEADRTEKQSDGLTLLKGDFVLYDGAAVLQTHAEFYGVLITEKAHELNRLVEKHKQENTDMVPVEIRGRISTEPHETIMWPNKVEIVEILNVYEPKPESNQTINLE